MNIFILDDDPVDAAQMLCDKHVIKMCLETAQILSTINGGPYKPTHENHPCVKWAEKLRNYRWLVRHGIGIAKEYRFRFEKVHKSEDVIYALEEPLVELEDTASQFVLCMPDIYKQIDAVQAYRDYYKGEKAHFAKWTKRGQPAWW